MESNSLIFLISVLLTLYHSPTFPVLIFYSLSWTSLPLSLASVTVTLNILTTKSNYPTFLIFFFLPHTQNSQSCFSPFFFMRVTLEPPALLTLPELLTTESNRPSFLIFFLSSLHSEFSHPEPTSWTLNKLALITTLKQHKEYKAQAPFLLNLPFILPSPLDVS